MDDYNQYHDDFESRASAHPVPKTQNANEPYYRQPPQPYPYQQPPQPLQNNNAVKIMLIVAGAVVVITILTTVALVILSQRDDEEQYADASSSATQMTAPTQEAAEKLLMPEVKGMAKEDAIGQLARLGVTVKESEMETDRQKPGYVFDQVPAKGKEIKAGDEVTLYIAKAKETQPTTQRPTVPPTTVPPTTQKPTQASVTYVYCKAQTYVSLRSGPGSSYSELARVYTNERMTYFSTSGDWYYVQYGSQTGYVHSHYVSFDANAPLVTDGSDAPARGTTLRCTADDFVSLRTGPDVSYTEQVRIPAGDTMTYISTSGAWYYVQYGSRKGYVSSYYVEFVN